MILTCFAQQATWTVRATAQILRCQATQENPVNISMTAQRNKV